MTIHIVFNDSATKRARRRVFMSKLYLSHLAHLFQFPLSPHHMVYHRRRPFMNQFRKLRPKSTIVTSWKFWLSPRPSGTSTRILRGSLPCKRQLSVALSRRPISPITSGKLRRGTTPAEETSTTASGASHATYRSIPNVFLPRLSNTEETASMLQYSASICSRTRNSFVRPSQYHQLSTSEENQQSQ